MRPPPHIRQSLRDVLAHGWYDLGDYPNVPGGTGAPGNLLEHLLGLNGSGGNADQPDADGWEVKYHSATALLTMFHKEGSPSGSMNWIVSEFGWPDQYGRTSFRHTLKRESDKGFRVVNDNERITVWNENRECLHWKHDTLINAFISKFRRLILVTGKKQKQRVNYETAHFYSEPRQGNFIVAVADGTVAIDFDARTKNGSGLRNHGTKFRIKSENLRGLYNVYEKFTPDTK